MGFPKLGIHCRPFARVPYISTVYMGGFVSAWWIIVAVGSIGVEGGFHLSDFIVESSIAYTTLASWESMHGTVGPVKKITFNPKIGYRFKMVSVRLGPTYNLKEILTESDRRNPELPSLVDYFLREGSFSNPNVDVRFSVYF